MSGLYFLLRNWQLIAVGAVIAVLLATVGVSRWELDRAERRAAHWEQEAAEYAASARSIREAYEQHKARKAEEMAAMERLKIRAETRAAHLAAIVTEAENATDDRDVGPVLERHAERLRARRLAPAGAGGDDAGRDGDAAGAAP